MKAASMADIATAENKTKLRRTFVPLNRLGARNWDLVSAFGKMWHPDIFAVLTRTLQELTGREHIVFTPSGQYAIAQLLSLLPQPEVVLPACTCPVVKWAAEVAGKRVIYADLGKDSVNSGAREYAPLAKPGRVLVATHLFGVPTDIEAICELAEKRDCVVIEDAAAAFGARQNGRLLGTFADFGIFSFQRSKRFPAFGGAIVVNNQRLIEPAALQANPIVKSRQKVPWHEITFAMAHNLGTAPWVYRTIAAPLLVRPERYTPLESGANDRIDVTETRDYTRGFHTYQAALLVTQLKRTEAIRSRIESVTNAYTDSFRNTAAMMFLPSECDKGGLLRFPVAFPSKSRPEILRRASKSGLSLAGNYGALPEPCDYSKFPNAVWAAQNIIQLPLYPALSAESATNVAQHLLEIARTL
ncbi:MAG: DegT/DnrJ/EryC1/StrS aminotransferase family protein [Acidobacteriaceae bacterium]|nr:DegT/DnrJ/EryC1/StrS aminotransferase family protein [Acidobacteriaceae bacterium]MBV9780488.1 DegT/DnrJ/EryC1/StrS aminotransferase family protein [Acidobacteriaceae bacterium]